MDFSRSRMRLGSGSGGAQMVKTYGRFKQRIVHREDKSAQEFARVAGTCGTLADILALSSDSDFEDTLPKAQPSSDRPRHTAVDDGAMDPPANDDSKPSRSRRNTASDAGTTLVGDAQSKGRRHDPLTTAPVRGAQRAASSRNKPSEPQPPAEECPPVSTRKIRSNTASKEGAAAHRSPAASAHREGPFAASAASAPAKPGDEATSSGAATQITAGGLPKRRPQAHSTNSSSRSAKSKPQGNSAKREGVCAAQGAHDDASSFGAAAMHAADPAAGPQHTPAANSRPGDAPHESIPPPSTAIAAMAPGPEVITAAVTADCEPMRPAVQQIDGGRAPGAAQSPISSDKVTRRRTGRSSRSTRSRHSRPSSLDAEVLHAAEEATLGKEAADQPQQEHAAVAPPNGEGILARRLSRVSVRGPEPEAGEAPAKASGHDPGSRPNSELGPDQYTTESTLRWDEDEESARQHLVARTMRFKAPHNARAQTFELDNAGDSDGDGDDNSNARVSGTPIRGARLSMPTTPHAGGDRDCQSTQDPSTPQRPTQEYALPSPPQPRQCVWTPRNALPRQQHDTTPQRAERGRVEQPPDVPHSPARMATPHRVVYSPTRPTTQMRHRVDPVGALKPTGEGVLAPPPLSQPSDDAASASSWRGPGLAADRLEPAKGRDAADRTSSGSECANEADVEETRVPFLPARRYVQKAHILAACGQTEPIDWATGGLQACGVLLPSPDPVQHSTAQLNEIESEAGLCKIGEATYSEVFSAQWRYMPRTRYDKFNSKKGAVKGERLMQVALKVIPFGNSSVKSGTGEPQTTLRDLYQEIGATLALSRLSERERAKLQEARMQVKMPLKPKERELGANFVKAFRVCICQGPLPAPLLRAWDRWRDEYPALCENVRPDYYPQSQLFAVFVLEMGGETLENAEVTTWKEARSIIRQLALSMALAERNNRFEHRDLHWGNIMVTRYQSNLTFLYQLPPSGSRLKSTLISIPSYRVRCTIIDYTLSRLHIDNDARDAAASKPASYDPANNVFYVALKDEALFQGEGDIQFDVYRQMRTCARDSWEGFYPQTNVLWLVYALQKILTTKAAGIRDELMALAASKLGPAFDTVPPELRRAACQELLRRWMREFEQCESCSQVLKCTLLDLYKGQ